MARPLPDNEGGNSPAGAAALRLATLAFAPPLPRGSWAERRQSILQKDFYTPEELKGKNLGPILQGAGTDRETAERMRRAVHEYRPCQETILNYHKNGMPYWVEVAITPILDDAGELLWLVARERELTDRIAA